ncbi:MAG TPA: hypothetical protein DCW88_01160 [Agrobacterium sp.]|uniref:hypothetical protein n=1 Tax=Agrobacterium pusense TaxID=648995 RepID=UPI000E8F244A|nr:hypothetical protein [Agrobacterium pusense]MDH0870039.1 ribonuclease E inhibitor RraB [Agrobacterium pusense]MDH1266565.1 ribonuclease E inhibitor RraB [Agrobacterium pusense]HAU74174.1 hypothetical protein [Agrobacterium sp.]
MLYRDFLVPRGYSITREAMDASQTARRGVEFSKPQAPNEIDREIELLSATAAKKLGGEYDGWGTEVEAS